LLERLLLAASSEGSLVLDPFLGSGTTAIACALLGRKCVGIESDRGHAGLAGIRLQGTLHPRLVQQELEVT
jgi:DNA modification methylase